MLQLRSNALERCYDAADAAPASDNATTATAAATRPLLPVTVAVLRSRVRKWLARNPLPLVEQPLDVAALRIVERRLRDYLAGLTRIVVRNRRLEPLSKQ